MIQITGLYLNENLVSLRKSSVHQQYYLLSISGPKKKNAETGVVTRMRKRRSTETGTARRNPQKKPKWFEITMRRRSRLRRTSAVAMMTTVHLALPALQMIQTSRVLIWT